MTQVCSLPATGRLPQVAHGDNTPRMAADEAELILRQAKLCAGLNAEQVREVARAVRWVSVRGGEALCRQNDEGNSMYVVVRGRLKVSVARSGEYRLLDYLGPGEHFGEMALLADGRRTATVSAVTDAELLELRHEEFQHVMQTVPGFAANLSRTLGMRLKWENQGRHARQGAAVVAVVSTSVSARMLLDPLARALAKRGETVRALSDWPAAQRNTADYQIEPIAKSTGQAAAASVRQRMTQLTEEADRLLLDIDLRSCHDRIEDLELATQIWWVIPSHLAETSLDALRQFVRRAPHLAARIHVVWLLPPDELFAPLLPEGLGIAPLDFKVDLAETTSWHVHNGSPSLTRLVRQIRGTRVGLALGGGGARGLAHIGALRAFRDAGIYFDHMAGTSSGALMGLGLAAGMDIDYFQREFHQALTPPRLFNWLPKGKRMYMLGMFRLDRWDAKLRPYFGQARLEQFRTPLSVLSVDLITGKQVVRDRGDAIQAVMESINLPGIAKPILREGAAMVDGGVFNNVPVDVLAERGTQCVIGVDVACRLRHKYAGCTPQTPLAEMKKGGMLDTLVRLNEIQAHELTTQRTRAADLMLSVDASAFEFADFTKGRELAAVGQRHAEQIIPALAKVMEDAGA